MSEVENRKRIISYITENNITTRDELRELWVNKPLEGITREKVEKELSIFKQYCANLGDEGLLNANSNLFKQKVKVQDKLNYHNRTFTKNLREINALEELNQELINSIKLLQVEKDRNLEEKIEEISPITLSEDILVVQLSDLHIGESTNQPFEQEYNIETASKRLKKFAEYIKHEIVSKGINKVVIFGTGDLVNSDSILSKQLNNMANKATAIIMAVQLLRDFIIDISLVCKDISFGTVSGNEGRFHNQEQYYTDENIVNNSPDYVVFNILNILFEKYEGIHFLRGRGCNRVLNINGQNVLFTHGVQLKGDYPKAISQLISIYASKGINIRYVYTGHLHEPYISALFARSGSLVGNNSYNEDMLNVSSRASQNISYIGKNGDINTMSIDLQDLTDISNGYYISKKDIKPHDIVEEIIEII